MKNLFLALLITAFFVATLSAFVFIQFCLLNTLGLLGVLAANIVLVLFLCIYSCVCEVRG